MTPKENGPARVGAQVGAGLLHCSNIVVNKLQSDHSCSCAAIEVQPTGQQFAAFDDGLLHHNGVEWRRIADFFAMLDPSSFDTSLPTVRVAVNRRGIWRYFEVQKAEFHSLCWLTRCLGAEAAASVTDSEALATAIILFGFVRGECKGCRHEA